MATAVASSKDETESKSPSISFIYSKKQKKLYLFFLHYLLIYAVFLLPFVSIKVQNKAPRSHVRIFENTYSIIFHINIFFDIFPFLHFSFRYFSPSRFRYFSFRYFSFRHFSFRPFYCQPA